MNNKIDYFVQEDSDNGDQSYIFSQVFSHIVCVVL